MFCLCVKTHEVGACDLNDKVKIFLKIRFCVHRLVVFFLPCKELHVCCFLKHTFSI